MNPVTLHVNAVGAVMGGAARHLPPFLAALSETRPDWRVTAHVSADAVSTSLPASVTINRVAASGKRRLRWDGWDVAREAERDGATALLNLTNYGPFRASVPSILYQRNPVYFDPSWVMRQSPRWRVEAALRRQIAYQQVRAASAVVVPSHAMSGFLRSWHGFPSHAPVFTIPHGVDTRRFTALPRNTECSRDVVQLLSVSHGASHKGQTLVVEVVAELVRRGHQAEATLTIDRRDDPRYFDVLESLMHRMKVSDHVRLAGRIRDVERLYQSCDLMIFPSYTESFGFPLVEAMACGVPVAASAIPSNVEVLGNDGHYFPPGDVQGAADEIEQILDLNTGDLAALAERLRLRSQCFSWNENARAVASVVEIVSKAGYGQTSS